MKKSSVSVVMSTYNAEDYITESIDSVLNQTFTDFEFIIIDDCSSDHTVDIIKSYKDPRIKLLVNDTNLGLTKNLNTGILLSTGKYIARMDADDIARPERLRKQFDFMEAHPEIGVCGTWYRQFGDEVNTVRYKTSHDDIVLRLLYQSHLCHPSVMIRKSVMIENNLFYNPSFITGQDYELWTRLCRITRLANIPEVLLDMRTHRKSVSAVNKLQQDANRDRIISGQFSGMKIEMTEKDIQFFIRLCYADFSYDIASLKYIEHLLLRMIEANRNTQCIRPDLFENFLCEKWYHACYNFKGSSDGCRIYFSSRLKSYQNIGLIALMKMRLRCLK